MTWPVVLGIAGTAMGQIPLVYNGQHDAPLMAYISAVCGALGGYLIGLYTKKPGGEP